MTAPFPWRPFGALSVVFWTICLFVAQGKPFFFDEICAVSLAALPTFAEIWQRIGEGLELNPPGYFYLLSLLPVPADPHLIYRIPSIFGCWLFALCTVDLLRYRVRATLALSCVTIPLFTSVADHVVEARSYGLILGLGALAFWAWMRGHQSPRAWPFWLVLAGAGWALTWLHYYAPYFLVSIAMGELVRARQRGWVWPVWAALVSAALPMAALLPLIRQHSRSSDTFFSGVLTGSLLAVYGEALAAAGLLLFAVAFAAFRVTGGGPRPAGFAGFEVCACAMLLLMPVVIFVVALTVTRAYTPRYLYPTLLGVTLLTAWALDQFPDPSRRLNWILTGGVCLYALAQFILLPLRPLPAEQVARSWTAPEGSEPIVVSSQLCFLELYQYAKPSLRARLRYLVDLESARRIQGADTPDRSLTVLAKMRPLPVRDFASFAREQTDFLLLGSNHLTWHVERLLAEHATLRALDHQFLSYCGVPQGSEEFRGYATLFRVTHGAAVSRETERPNR